MTPFYENIARLGLTALTLACTTVSYGAKTGEKWKIGSPIVTYWAGPGYGPLPMTDEAAKQMKAGGWNLVWCHEKELDIAQHNGLRAQLTDPLLTPTALDNPEQRKALDALIARVRKHPALYSYFLSDEPTANHYSELSRLFAYLHEKDPAHLPYVNLFPTYATNEQLGTKGDTIPAYKEYLQRYIDIVKPPILSYDHYQFAVGRDAPDYFLNLALMRQAALDAKLPFLNIVQACTWDPSMREPTEEEMRYLVYTTLAYGAQGISYYVYAFPGHTPGIATLDGKPTRVYTWLKQLNPEFSAIASQTAKLQSLGVYHQGMMPPGAEALPKNAPFVLTSDVPTLAFQPNERVRGVLLGYFGKQGKNSQSPTHALVVNLDYKAERTVRLRGTAPLELFDPSTGKWTPSHTTEIEIHLQGGGGKLVRIRP